MFHIQYLLMWVNNTLSTVGSYIPIVNVISPSFCIETHYILWNTSGGKFPHAHERILHTTMTARNIFCPLSKHLLRCRNISKIWFQWAWFQGHESRPWKKNTKLFVIGYRRTCVSIQDQKLIRHIVVFRRTTTP